METNFYLTLINTMGSVSNLYREPMCCVNVLYKSGMIYRPQIRKCSMNVTIGTLEICPAVCLWCNKCNLLKEKNDFMQIDYY